MQNISINNKTSFDKKKLITPVSMVASAGAYAGAYNAASLASCILNENIDNAAELSKKESSKVNKALCKVFESENLKASGSKLIMTPVIDGDYLDVTNFIQKAINNKDDEFGRLTVKALCPDDSRKGISEKLFEKLDEILRNKKGNIVFDKLHTFIFGDGVELFDLDNFVSLKLGDNAFYSSNADTVFVPNKKINISGFHEIGHCMNQKLSKTGAYLQKIQDLCPYIAGAVIIGSLLTPDKDDKNSKIPKPILNILNFFKDNAGKLTFLSFAPILIEEAMASFKGEAAASKFLNSDLLKKVKHANRLSLLSYVLEAGAIGFSGYLSIKTKDFVQEKLKKTFFSKENCSSNGA